MKTIDDALELRGRIFGAFEMAELASESTQREAWLTFVVVGAGPTGVELAGQIAELSRRALQRNYRSFDPQAARIILLEATDTVLAPFPEPPQDRARRDLQRLGVEVRLRTLVTGLDRSGLDVKQLGTMATIARFRAVVFIGRVHLTGFAAWLMWLLVHLAFLTGFKNRLAAVTNWAVAFLGYDRRQRTITEQQVFARTRRVKQPAASSSDRALLERPSGRGCR